MHARPTRIIARRILSMAFALAALAILTAVSTPAFAEETHEGGMPPMGAPAQMKDIAFLQGDWTVDMQVRMGPDAGWMPVKGEAQVRSELDGCLQRMDFASEMMGMPFKGLGLDSYNRETGKYDSYWIDTMSAKMTRMSGGFEDGKLVMTGTDMMMGKTQLMKSVTEKLSDDEVSFVMSVSMDQGKTWFTNMKMIYHRKK